MTTSERKPRYERFFIFLAVHSARVCVKYVLIPIMVILTAFEVDYSDRYNIPP